MPLNAHVRKGPRYVGLAEEHVNLAMKKLTSRMKMTLRALKPWRKMIMVSEKRNRKGIRRSLFGGARDDGGIDEAERVARL
jgi:hypothetical protein